MTRPRQTVTHLPIEQLLAHPGNVREDLGDLTELAMSIRAQGILQPVGATEHHAEPDRYVLLYGHRRLAAGVLAGLTVVPAIVRHSVDDADQIVLNLVENIHRRDLDPIERAEAFAALINQGLTQAQVAQRAGVLPSNVSRSLVLLDLPLEEQAEIRAGQRSAYRAISEQRQVRQEQRAAAGQPAMGTTVRRGTPGGYFSSSHRLADFVRRGCTHRNLPMVGNVGCGPCWEKAIVEEAALGIHPTPQAPDVDEVAIQRRLNGDKRVQLTKADRFELVRIGLERGMSQKDIETRTGVNVTRYLPPKQEAS